MTLSAELAHIRSPLDEVSQLESASSRIAEKTESAFSLSTSQHRITLPLGQYVASAVTNAAVIAAAAASAMAAQPKSMFSANGDRLEQ
jgi:hypothetical protein